MLPISLNYLNLFLNLYLIDKDVAVKRREKGCPYCKGPLHNAFYQRKPRSGPIDLPEEYCVRMGLCCGHCRRRCLPPSCLFMDRRVYLRVTVLVVMTLWLHKPPKMKVNQLVALFGVTPSTIRRWRRFFREVFPKSPLWTRLRGKVDVAIHNDELPHGLVAAYTAQYRDEETALKCCARFLAGID
jgi:hypothetical protein